MSNMLSGSPLLMGDNTIPGVKIPKEVEEQIPTILKACTEFGLDFYPPVIEFLTYDEISEIASYGGFPVRYPHWQFGMEYEELSRGYEFGMHRISEMVINNSPAWIYCLDSNTLVDNVDVIAHALGHSDFFKNNVYFEPTNSNMLNKMANHGTRIRKYMKRHGKEKVTEFIDHVLRIQTLIDPAKAWKNKKIEEVIPVDKKEYHFPRRIDADHDYMNDWLNPKRHIDKEHKRIARKDAAEELGLFGSPEKDVFGFIKDNAPLKPWQQDIISMLYDEAIYFSPQGQTKMANEGFASYVDFHVLCSMGLVSAGQKRHDMGIFHYAEHKMRVLGGKYSMNPYKLGFELFMDIEDRWNKGKFGVEYEECEDRRKKEKWDLKLGLGREKALDVRKYYNDLTMILEFFTPEFCEKNEFFEWKRYPNGEYKIVNRDFKSIKKKLVHKYMNRGLPDIRITEDNAHGKGWLMLQHFADGRPLYDPYAREVLTSLFWLWKEIVVLSTQNKNGEDFVYVCGGTDVDNDILIVNKDTYLRDFVERSLKV